MKKEKMTLEQYAQQLEQAQEHAQEIQRTRVGGLGGSDADMLLRVGRNGMAALTSTDLKRLSVMMGISELEQWGGNEHTQAGHAFEDFIEENMPFGDNVKVERETLLNRAMAKNFKTFAHADFTYKTQGASGLHNGFTVVECKFVQDDTERVAKKYEAQLQWYYILGASHVILLHGRGAVPFDENDVETVKVNIERDESVHNLIIAGLQTLDDAISEGWKPITPERIDVADASATVQRAFETLRRIKQTREEIEKEETDAKAVIMQYMSDFSYSSITDGEHTASVTKESVTLLFDKSKLFKEYPELDNEKYYKSSTRKASLTFK